MSGKIRLITYRESGIEMVSHGVDENTLRTVCLPPEPVATFRPQKDEGGWYLDDSEPSARPVPNR